MITPRRLFLLVLIVFPWATLDAQSSCTYGWDTRFTTIGARPIKAMMDWNDGNGMALFLGGRFSDIADTTVANIVRFDGVQFSPLGSGLSSTAGVNSAEVHALVVFDDGTGPALYVGGSFSIAGGTPARNLAKWNGSTWSAVGSTVGNTPNSAGNINDLVVWDDGTGPALYACGLTFRDAANTVITGVAKWTGTTWSSIGNLTIGSVVNALAVHHEPNGTTRLYVGGTFQSVNAMPLSRGLASWDGATWHIDASLGFTSVVTSLAEYASATPPLLIVGGTFSASASGAPIQNLAAWNGTGYTNIGANAQVTKVAVAPFGNGDSVYAHGSFTQAAGIPAERIVRWTPTAAAPLGLGTFFGGSGTLGTSSIGGTASRLIVAGIETTGDVAANGLSAYDAFGWHSFTGQGVAPDVARFAVDPNGPTLYAAGIFTSAGSALVGGIARWNGSTWSRVGNGIGFYTGSNLISPPSDMIVFDDGTGPALVVGGDIQTVDGVPASGVARWNGNAWSAMPGLTFPIGIPFNPGNVYSFGTYAPSGPPSLYAGISNGGIGTTPYALARWTGSNWVGVTGISGTILSMATFDDGSGPRLFVCGLALVLNGGATTCDVAAWNGATWQAIGQNFATSPANSLSPAQSLVVHDDGTGPALYVAGSFTAINGVPARQIARWTGIGWIDVGETLVPVSGNQSVYVTRIITLPTADGEALVAVGAFGLNGVAQPINVMMRTNGTWSGLGLQTDGFSAVSRCIAAFPDGPVPSLFVGGRFTGIAGVTSINIARYAATTPTTCAVLGPAARGQVGATAGGPFNVLAINGSAGGYARRVDVGIGQPLTFEMLQPPSSPLSAPFEIFGFIGVPNWTDAVTLPFNLGPAAFPLCPLAPTDPRLFELTNNLLSNTCAPLMGSSPTPWAKTIAAGIPFPASFALQGVLYDATSPQVFSTTNAVLCVIQ